METKRKVAIATRFSILIVIIHFIVNILIWGFNHIPSVDRILLWSYAGTKTYIHLPPLSRWFDLLLGPIYSFALVFLIVAELEKLKRENAEIAETLILFSIIALMGGFMATFLAGPTAGTIAGFVIGFVGGVVGGIRAGLVAGLVGGLGVGFAAGLVGGLVAGLVAGLGVVITAGFLTIIIFVFKQIVNKQVWGKILRWFLAE